MHGPASRFRRHAIVAFALCTSAALAACSGSATVRAGAVYGYPVYEPDYVPERIYYYPRAYYRGNYAYLVDGRWYYPRQGRWVVFRSEPQELRRYRVYRHDRYEPGRRYRAPAYEPYPRRPEYAAPPARRHRQR